MNQKPELSGATLCIPNWLLVYSQPSSSTQVVGTNHQLNLNFFEKTRSAFTWSLCEHANTTWSTHTYLPCHWHKTHAHSNTRTYTRFWTSGDTMPFDLSRLTHFGAVMNSVVVKISYGRQHSTYSRTYRHANKTHAFCTRSLARRPTWIPTQSLTHVHEHTNTRTHKHIHTVHTCIQTHMHLRARTHTNKPSLLLPWIVCTCPSLTAQC